jgi:hypothetical protein
VSEEIFNRVASSPLITIDLEAYLPDEKIIPLDMKDMLYEGMILKEKDFRTFVKENDWSQYKDAYVALFCSTDAIIPKWAYMILVSKLLPFARTVYYGSPDELVKELTLERIRTIDSERYRDKKIVIKGCGDKNITEPVYMEVVAKLQPVASSIMYGEPCSTVPVYKKSRR